MSLRRVDRVEDLEPDLTSTLSHVRYATMVTVDARHRPRTRVLIATWELEGDRPIGWLATYRTPVKVAHLAANPHVSFSYWSPRQDTATLDGSAHWIETLDAKRHAWQTYREGSPAGVGYDPAGFWSGPDDPAFGLLRIDVERVQLLLGRELATGTPPRAWSVRRKG